MPNVVCYATIPLAHSYPCRQNAAQPPMAANRSTGGRPGLGSPSGPVKAFSRCCLEVKSRPTGTGRSPRARICAPPCPKEVAGLAATSARPSLALAGSIRPLQYSDGRHSSRPPHPLPRGAASLAARRKLRPGQCWVRKPGGRRGPGSERSPPSDCEVDVELQVRSRCKARASPWAAAARVLSLCRI